MGSESVKVVVRCRPLSDRETTLGSRSVVSVDLRRCQCFIQKPGAPDEPHKQFTFDGTYDTEHSTETVYNEVAYPLVEGVTEGYNGTIFAYGQTGSGKSFTMQGVTEPPAQRGVIPRAFEHIFESIQCAENTKFLVRASYLEIYNEEIRDLLGSDTKHKLELKEHPERGVYVRDLSLHSVHSVSECERIIQQGWRNRAVGYTLMNKDSSRSHSIFSIHLEICSTDADGQDHLRAGKLNLVDLAGSERQSKTGATGERLREATKINLSLSALGHVISALVDSRCKFVPYRDSKLTRLLQDSLGGNTRTLMVACLSPADSNYEESLSTLRYADRAKSIQNRPQINQDPKDALLREYQDEIRRLRALVSGQLAGANAASLPAAQKSDVPPTPPSRSTDSEKEKIKEEYELRLSKLQADYDAEQESKAKLQEDMAALRCSYQAQLSGLEEALAGGGNAEPENQDHPGGGNAESQNQDHPAGETSSTEVQESRPEGQNPPEGDEITESHDGAAGGLDQQHVLERLQQLEQQVVGGEQARNKELQQRQRQRRKMADRRKLSLMAALSEDGDDSDSVLLHVYTSIQEELHAKSQLLLRVQGKLKAAKLEIRDLQAEFGVERDDFLSSLRRLEREGRLLHGLLERMATLVRRDCNYSNLDRLKREAAWDEDAGVWRLPDVTLHKTTLPSAVAQKPAAGSRSSDTGEPHVVEEDRYRELLDRRDSEHIASCYFKSKRASQLLGRDSAKGHGGAKGHAVHSPPLVSGPAHLAASGSGGPVGSEGVVPRPFRLESLGVPPPNGKVRRKKSKSHIHSEGL